MANNASTSLDKWREYFRTANSDIFEIIEHAIIVAASDCPNEFKLKRDRIAEMLFTCKVTKCFGCERIGLALPVVDDGVQKSDDKCKSGIEAGGSKDSKESTKESKSNSNGDDYHREVMEMMNGNQVSNNSYDDAEALTDEIEEESQYLSEVLRIKEIIDNNEHESESLLFDSLRKLQLMRFSVETLKATEIGKSVNALRKHRSNDIRKLARILIEDWKLMVDAWVSTTAAIAAAVVTPQSVKASVDGEEEEDGLPSPPLDEGAFFATPTSMELSQFFDGMDDDGNPRNSGEFNKNRDHGRKPTANGSNYPPRNNKPEQKTNQESMLKPNNRPRPNPVNGVSGPGRPKPVLQTKANNETTPQQKPDKSRSIQQKPVLPQREKMNGNNESPVRMNLEAAKRKLQERYQEIEKVKRQKTIQVIDLPKQNVASRNHPIRPAANQNRNRANGRR